MHNYTRDSEAEPEFAVSVLITVVGGAECVRRCLLALRPQLKRIAGEIIVPYDLWSKPIGELEVEFPEVRFHFITELGAAANANIPAHQHRLYDLRRAVGLSLARGRLIAMTEDLAIPADDWLCQILAVHRQHPHGVIGGSIDNAIDSPMNWALYYCDHGRYGSPLPAREAEYVSDINISYKREALESIREVWREAYHETTVHWALRDRGVALRLDPALKVYKHRPPISFLRAIRERAEWGRIFAETRVAAIGLWQRIYFAVFSPLLPALLLARAFKHMLRQRRTLVQLAMILPLVIALLAGWSWGELIGYVCGEPLLMVPTTDDKMESPELSNAD